MSMFSLIQVSHQQTTRALYSRRRIRTSAKVRNLTRSFPYVTFEQSIVWKSTLFDCLIAGMPLNRKYNANTSGLEPPR